MNNIPYLAPCAFCGYNLNKAAQIDGSLIDLVYPTNKGKTLWKVSCPEYAGGCTAIILGDTAEQAISNWNHRHQFSRPNGHISTLSRDELFHAYMELHAIVNQYIDKHLDMHDEVFLARKAQWKAEHELKKLREELGEGSSAG